METAADLIVGGLGNDTLTGGAGTDTFFFNAALNGTTNVDTITDFSVADDTFRLENTGFFTALTATGTLAATAFVVGAAAADALDRIIYNSSTGIVSYDSDGTGANAAIAFAKVTPLTGADQLGFLRGVAETKRRPFPIRRGGHGETQRGACGRHRKSRRSYQAR